MSETIKAAEGQLPSQPLPANTTEQEDLTKSGQRNINLIWESTQAKIALLAIRAWLLMNGVVIAAMIYWGNRISSEAITVILTALSSISLTVGIIIGFYFSRTNHTAIGGVGKKDIQSSVGTR